MKTISSERANQHWRAINSVTPAVMEEMLERTVVEQPAIMGAVAEMSGGLDVGPDGKSLLESGPDEELSDLVAYSTTAMFIHEIMRREAGCRSRTLTQEDIDDLLESHKSQFEPLLSAKPDVNAFKDFINSHSQSGLLKCAWLRPSLEGDAHNRDSPAALFVTWFVLDAFQRGYDSAPSPEEDIWEVPRIVIALSSMGDPLRHKALEMCERFREEMIPKLIAELERWVDAAEEVLDENGVFGIHALYLLAKWREDSAWSIVRRLLSLPGDDCLDLTGDLITEDASILVAMMGWQHVDELQDMIQDEQLNIYCRGACVDSLTCLVAWGDISRESHVNFLRSLLASKLRRVPENEYVFGRVVAAACDLMEETLRGDIVEAYEGGYTDELFCSLDYCLDMLAGNAGDGWQKFQDDHKAIGDVALATAWMDEPTSPNDDELIYEPEQARALTTPGQPYIAQPKVGRNEPCPCGSCKKYKKCCGKN